VHPQQRVTWKASYKLEVRLYAPQYQPVTFRCPQLRPFLFMCRVDICSEILRPIDSSRLSVANVGHVVDMAFGT